MGINSKIAKIPFWVLYLVLAALTLFNWIRVIMLQTDFEAFRYTQPWDYYLSRFFADTFGTAQKQYFIFALPIILVCLYLIPKLFKKIMSIDKNSNVRGDNHVAVILILLTVPSVLGLSVTSGIVLIVLFSILSWMDEKKAKR